MSSPTGPASGLPVRMPRPRQPGRHRRPEPLAAPEGAPALVLAVPGTPGAATRSLAEEVVSIARSELPGLDARIGYLDGDDAEFPTLQAVLVHAAEERAARYRAGQAAGLDVKEPDGPVAVVVPLLAGPDSALLRRIRQAVMDSRVAAELTDVLGPHPLLAEALHVRLSEAGLARADRARLFTVATAADGIILASVGGEEAVQAAGITGMLLAARLAVPVMAAALDQEGSIAVRGRAAAQLGLAAAGARAVPDRAGDRRRAWSTEAAKEAGCSAAEPLGPYPAIGKLALAKYTTALGIAPQQAQGTPVR